MLCSETELTQRTNPNNSYYSEKENNIQTLEDRDNTLPQNSSMTFNGEEESKVPSQNSSSTNLSSPPGNYPQSQGNMLVTGNPQNNTRSTPTLSQKIEQIPSFVTRSNTDYERHHTRNIIGFIPVHTGADPLFITLKISVENNHIKISEHLQQILDTKINYRFLIKLPWIEATPEALIPLGNKAFTSSWYRFLEVNKLGSLSQGGPLFKRIQYGISQAAHEIIMKALKIQRPLIASFHTNYQAAIERAKVSSKSISYYRFLLSQDDQIQARYKKLLKEIVEPFEDISKTMEALLSLLAQAPYPPLKSVHSLNKIISYFNILRSHSEMLELTLEKKNKLFDDPSLESLINTHKEHIECHKTFLQQLEMEEKDPMQTKNHSRLRTKMETILQDIRAHPNRG